MTGTLIAHVDAGHDALGSVPLRNVTDQCGVGVRRGVDGDLVGTGAQQALNLPDVGDASSDGKRHEAIPTEVVDGFEVRVVIGEMGHDVQQHEFIHVALVVHLDCRQHGSDPTPAVKADTLDQTQLFPQQRRNDTNFQHP